MGILLIIAGSLLAAAALLALATAWVIFAAKLYHQSKLTLFLQSGLGLVLAIILLGIGTGLQSGH